MARFSWSRSLVSLVLALACFSEISCAAPPNPPAPTTTPSTHPAPTTTPSSNITTAASNMTTAASNMTTTTSNMTTTTSNMTTTTSNMNTTTSNMTTTTSNMTTTTSNMTTTTSNMTTTTSNMTTTPSNMTTTPSNMTTTPSNMTTIPSNMSTTPSNMTTIPSNMTTIPSNMTTSPSNMTTTSTTLPVTTSAPEARWKVKNKDGKLCMLMDFDGRITYKQTKLVEIPLSASIAKSSCESAASSQFVVEFGGDDFSFWQLILNFTTAKGSKYKLNKMTMNLYVNSSMEASGFDEHGFFTVPNGDFYKCDFLNATLSLFSVNLTKPTFQPFVQKTKGGDNLGQEYQCTNRSPGNHTNIIIGIIIAIIVLAAAVGVTYYVVKRRGNPSDPPYARVN